MHKYLIMHNDLIIYGSRFMHRFPDIDKDEPYDNLSDYPWLKSVEHLKRVNKYLKRVGQKQVRFSEYELLELAMTSKE